MRVLHYYHIYDNPPSGGVENYINSVSVYLSDRCSFSVLSDLLHRSKINEDVNGVNVIRVGPAKPLKRGRIADILKNTFSRERSKRKIIREMSPDVIHVHGPTIYSNLSLIGFVFYPFYFLQGWKRASQPKIFTFHGLPEYVIETKYSNRILVSLAKFFWRRIENKNVRDSKFLICVDKYVYDDMRSRNLPRGKILYIPNGIDTNVFRGMVKYDAVDELNKRFNLHLSPGEKIFSYVARLSKEKGIEHILGMRNIEGDFKVLICGGGPYLHDIEKLCSEDSRFIYLGNLPESSLPYVYNASDLVLNPALHPASTRTTIEAVCCERPVLMFGIGNRYPLVNGVTGTIVNENEFNESIEKFLIGKIKFKMTRSTISKMREEFDIRNISNRIMELYEKSI